LLLFIQRYQKENQKLMKGQTRSRSWQGSRREFREEQAVTNGLMKNLSVLGQKAEFFDEERKGL
jgi:BRCA1-associated protein